MKRSNKYISAPLLEQKCKIKIAYKRARFAYENSKSKTVRYNWGLLWDTVSESYETIAGCSMRNFHRKLNQDFFKWAGYEARKRGQYDRLQYELMKFRGEV